MKIAIIGCGYVADHYLKTLHHHPILELSGVTDVNRDRAQAVASMYGTDAYPTNADLLADPDVSTVVNLTNPESHFELNMACLEAGKHVYCEKPLTKDIAQAQQLLAFARDRNLLLSGAPCNILSDSVQTMWTAALGGAIGRVQLAYAEFDANPIYLMKPEGWRSASGAPWPYKNEYEEGCTVEHAGYYLSWLAAMFGPARSVTPYSACLVPDKSPVRLDPPDTPDFSVACIEFDSGVTARLTVSIVAPFNHRMTVIGNRGLLTTDTYSHYRSPIFLERFNQVSLNARKASSVRRSTLLQRIFGVGGRKVRLVKSARTTTRTTLHDYLASSPPVLGAAIKSFKEHELGAQDKLLGVVEMAEALRDRRKCRLPTDFVVHVTELTLAISNASASDRGPYKVKTTFEPLSPRIGKADLRGADYGGKGGVFSRATEKLIARLHQH